MKIVCAILSFIALFQPMFAMQTLPDDQNRVRAIALSFVASGPQPQPQPNRPTDEPVESYRRYIQEIEESTESNRLRAENESLKRKNAKLKLVIASLVCLISLVSLTLSIVTLVLDSSRSGNTNSTAPGNFTG